MPQFLISSKTLNNNKIVISDKDNYIHIAKSLRAKVGEKLLLIDENQIQYETVIEKITPNEITVNVENNYKSYRKLDFKLYLGQVPLRSDAQSIIIEKATELGADRVYPIISDNCALNKSTVEKKIPKWQRIMYEAFKQCERAYVPKCFEQTTLEDAIIGDYKVVAFCERFATTSLHEYISKNPIKKDDKIMVIIGPEGGFSKREFELFRKNNIPMITLGNLILKAETAVIVALGNLIYEYNNQLEN